MNDNYYYYFCLNAYLSRADYHYVESRFLWLGGGIDGACIILWLAIEQIIKLNIVQHRIETKLLADVEWKGKKICYDPRETDADKINTLLDKTFYKIDSRHTSSTLLSSLKKETGTDLYVFEESLKKLEEFFNRRYYVAQSTSINWYLLDKVDEIYFLLRGKINDNVRKQHRLMA